MTKKLIFNLNETKDLYPLSLHMASGISRVLIPETVLKLSVLNKIAVILSQDFPPTFD